MNLSILSPFDTKPVSPLKGLPFGKRSPMAFMKSDSVMTLLIQYCWLFDIVEEGLESRETGDEGIEREFVAVNHC